MLGPTQGNRAARQGGWAPLPEHPCLCWARPKPDHCKKFLEFNFFFLGGAWTGPHRNTTRTSSCNTLGQPQREGSLVSNPTCSQSLENIWREKKCGSSYYPFHWILFHNPWRWTKCRLFLLVTISHPATHPQLVPRLSMWISVFDSQPTPCFCKGCLQPPPPQSSLCSSIQRTNLRRSTFLFFHRERPIASDNGIKWTSRTLSSKISSHKDWVVMRVIKDR